jgi:hypothetical protein
MILPDFWARIGFLRILWPFGGDLIPERIQIFRGSWDSSYEPENYIK